MTNAFCSSKYSGRNISSTNFGGLYGELYDAVVDDQGQGVSSFVTHQYDYYVAGTVPLGKRLRASANIGYGKNFYTHRSGFNGGVTIEQSLGNETHVGAEWIAGDDTGVFGTVASNTSNVEGVTHANLYLTQ